MSLEMDMEETDGKSAGDGQERDKLRHDAVQNTLQNAIKLHEFNAAWSENLTAILANTINNEEISSDLLRLPTLPRPIPPIHDYSFTTEEYVFAEVYTGLKPDIFPTTRDDVWIFELLFWTNNMFVPCNIPANSFDQIAWLEANFLKEVRIRQTRDSWVLLAFSLLSKLVISDSWPACCIAAVRLAVLKRQYLPYDTAVWDNFVADLMKKYNSLDINPLGQTCLAYLCLTTSNPQATMTQTLPETLSRARFDTSVRIPVLLATLGSPDVALAHRNGALSVVIVRRQDQEVVFSKSYPGWSLSTQPLKAEPAPDFTIKITWGLRSEQSIVVDRASDVWSYINRHHSTTLIAKFRKDTAKRIQAMLDKLRQPIN